MQTDYSPIPDTLRSIYAEIEDNMIWLESRWIMFCQLYCESEHRVVLLNESAPSFFAMLQGLWLDYVILEICRLTDDRKDSLGIKQLSRKLDSVKFPILAAKLSTKLLAVKTATEPLRNRRDKSIAHQNLATALCDGDTIAFRVSQEEIKNALHLIRDFLNTFRIEFLGTAMGFDSPALLDDATTLIFQLKRAAEYRDLERNDATYRSRIRQGRFSNA